MADWIIEGGDKPTSGISENPIVRGAGQLGIGAAEGLAGLAGLPGSALQALFGSPKLTGRPFLPTSQELVGGVRNLEQKYLPESYQQPEGTIETFLRNLGGNVPGAAIGAVSGGAALPLVASSLGGAAAETGAQQLGLGPIAQAISGLAGSMGGSRLAGSRIPSVRQVKKTEDTLMRAAVEPNAKSLISKELGNSLKDIEGLLKTEASGKIETKITHALNKVKENITMGGINPTKAVDLRASLYNLKKELPENIAQKYIQPLIDGTNEFFSLYSAENPAFYKHLSARDKLTSLTHMKPILKKGIEAAGVGKNAAVDIPIAVVNAIISPAEKFMRGMLRNSEARKYYSKAALAVAKNNPAEMVKNLNSLASYIGEEESESPETGGWVIE